MLLYNNYYLEERGYATTSIIWKGCHIFLLITASILSIASCVFFHILFATFDMNCVLNPKLIIFKNDNSTDEPVTNPNQSTVVYKQTVLPVDFIKSQWANINDCYGSLYNPIISVIFGIVWFTFFLMCSKGGKSVSGLQQPWRIVVPSAMFTFIYSIVCIVISSRMTHGLENFSKVFNNITDINNDKYYDGVRIVNEYVLINIIMTWLYTACWILSFLILITRCICMPDFQLMQMRVHLIENPCENGKTDNNHYMSTSTSPALKYIDTPSTSTGIFENHNSMLVVANVEPNDIKRKDIIDSNNYLYDNE